MNTININSSQLPNLPMSIKHKINKGIWHLYKINSPYAYALNAEQTILFLDEMGDIKEAKFLETIKTFPNIESTIYFEDLPKPPCMSEMLSTLMNEPIKLGRK